MPVNRRRAALLFQRASTRGYMYLSIIQDSHDLHYSHSGFAYLAASSFRGSPREMAVSPSLTQSQLHAIISSDRALSRWPPRGHRGLPTWQGRHLGMAVVLPMRATSLRAMLPCYHRTLRARAQSREQACAIVRCGETWQTWTDCCGGNADDHSPGPYQRPPCMHLCRLCLISLASAQLLRCLLSWYSLSSCEPPSMLGFRIPGSCPDFLF
jgi:hypothetical protein